MKAKVAVFVSGGGTNLQAILDASSRGEIPSAEIALVATNKSDAYALVRAANANVKTFVAEKLEGEKRRDVENKLLDAVLSEKIDLIVLAGFMMILSENFVKSFPGKIINIHPALIPSFCGMGFYGLRVHEAVLERGVKVTGATAHLVNGEVDGGPILLQKAVEVLPGDTPEALQKRVMEQAEWELLPRAVRMISDEIVSGRN